MSPNPKSSATVSSFSSVILPIFIRSFISLNKGQEARWIFSYDSVHFNIATVLWFSYELFEALSGTRENCMVTKFEILVTFAPSPAIFMRILSGLLSPCWYSSVMARWSSASKLRKALGKDPGGRCFQIRDCIQFGHLSLDWCLACQNKQKRTHIRAVRYVKFVTDIYNLS